MTMPPILPIYRRSDITMVRGQGCYLYDEMDKRYLDFATGIGVNALGHNHPHAVDALKAQAEELWHCSNLYMHPTLEQFAQQIVADTFADTVFFCSTGSEAVECALKMARKHHYSKGNKDKTRFITFTGGFHGRSFAGISAGGNQIAREGYAPLLEGFDQVTFNDINAVQQSISEKTAAILIEPIQGEGGFFEAREDFLQGVKELANQHDLLLICDEVQSGLGRSGELLAYMRSGIKPDIVCIAKALGNGFPIAATLATEHAATCMTPGSHGSTYGANPLAMAVGYAVWKILVNNEFQQHIRKMGEELENALIALQQEFPDIIANIRGRCLMRGLLINEQCPIDHYVLTDNLRHAGLLTAPAAGDRVIRLLPPLVIESQHINQAAKLLKSELSKIG